MEPRTNSSEFAVGEGVWAFWNAPQSYYYIGSVLKAGKIVRNQEGTMMSATDYVVRFDDGDEMPVAPDLIYPARLPAGMQIEFRTRDDPRYQAAVVVAATHDSVTILPPGQEEISVSLAAIRVEGRILKKQV